MEDIVLGAEFVAIDCFRFDSSILTVDAGVGQAIWFSLSFFKMKSRPHSLTMLMVSCGQCNFYRGSEPSPTILLIKTSIATVADAFPHAPAKCNLLAAVWQGELPYSWRPSKCIPNQLGTNQAIGWISGNSKRTRAKRFLSAFIDMFFVCRASFYWLPSRQSDPVPSANWVRKRYWVAWSRQPRGVAGGNWRKVQRKPAARVNGPRV